MSPQQNIFFVSGIFRTVRNWGRLKIHLFFHWCDYSRDHGHILWKHCLIQGLLFISDRTECNAFALNTAHLAIVVYAYKKCHTVLTIYSLYTAALERVVWYAIQRSLQTFNVVVHSQEWMAYKSEQVCPSHKHLSDHPHANPLDLNICPSIKQLCNQMCKITQSQRQWTLWFISNKSARGSNVNSNVLKE